MGDSGNSSKTDRPWLWKPGQSGNPSGRPKSLGMRFRAATQDGELLKQFCMDVLAGRALEVPREARMTDGSLAQIDVEDSKTGQPVAFVVPGMEDRRWAFQVLMERGFGRVAEKVEITGAEGAPLFDPETLDAPALENLAAFLTRVVPSNPDGTPRLGAGDGSNSVEAEFSEIHSSGVADS